MTYQEQINHPRWQKKRLQVLRANKWKCAVCGSKDEQLHVHHPYYKHGAMIWEYDKTELQCLCHIHHKEAHVIDDKIKRALAVCKDKETVLRFIKTVNGGTASQDEVKPVVLRRGAIERKKQRESEIQPKSMPVGLADANRSYDSFMEKLKAMTNQH